MFEIGNTAGVIHGQSRTPEYRAWIDIKSRCLNADNRFYPYYGGRGIRISPEWMADFGAFLEDVGPRPTEHHTIDRYPDNNGHYEPGNVRWATRMQQVANRRSTRMVEYDGRKIPVSEACRILGLNRKTVSGRIDRGWSPERAITPSLWLRS